MPSAVMCGGTAQPRCRPRSAPAFLPPAAARDARPRRVCPSQLLLDVRTCSGSAGGSGTERSRAQPPLAGSGKEEGLPPPPPPASRRDNAGESAARPNAGNLPNFLRPGSRHSLPWPPATLPATSRHRRLRTAQVSGARRDSGDGGWG